MFFKRLRDFKDEEFQTALDERDGDLTFTDFAENDRFQIPDRCHWQNVKQKLLNEISGGL